MRHLSVLVVAVACLCQPATADERQPALDQLRRCVDAHIDTLDDGVSPAQEIARAIALACQPQVAEFAKAEAIHDGHPEQGFIHELAQGDMDGQMFLGDVLRHRTTPRDIPALTASARDEGVSDNDQLVMLCHDPRQHLVCLGYFRGWIDAYVFGIREHCPDADMGTEHFVNLYLSLMARSGATNRVRKDPPGGVLAAIMQEHSHSCK